MKFLDLPLQDKKIQAQIVKAIKQIIKRGDFILGKEVEELEAAFRDYFNIKHAIAVGSGTDALLLSLKALNLEMGGEVITTPFTFFASSESIINAQLKPVFAQIDPRTFNIDPQSIEQLITKKTKAILPVHIFGQSCQMAEITKLAKKHHLMVIEDCAQAFGAKFSGQYVGTFGTCGCFSFYPTKNLGAYGDAGLVITNDDEVAETIRILRNHGSKEPYCHEYLGLNSRCDTFQAAVLLAKLPHLSSLNHQRKENAKRYAKNLQDVNEITLPYENSNCDHIFHQFSILAKQRDQLKTYLLKEGVSTQIYYELSLPMQKIMVSIGYGQQNHQKELKCITESILSLPIAPSVTGKDIDYICKKIRGFYHARI